MYMYVQLRSSKDGTATLKSFFIVSAWLWSYLLLESYVIHPPTLCVCMCTTITCSVHVSALDRSHGHVDR